MAKSKHRQKKALSEAEPKDRLSWRYWLLGLCIVAVIVGGVFLLSELTKPDPAIPFTFDAEDLIREEDGLRYVKAPKIYEVKAYTKPSEPRYGRAGKVSIYKVGYTNAYDIVEHLNADHYLTDGQGTLYYNPAAVSLPDLEMFDAKEVHMGLIASNGDVEVVDYRRVLTNENGLDATNFVKQYLAKEIFSLDEDRGAVAEEICHLKLVSAKYPYLYYIMSLGRCQNGEFFVYTATDKTLIRVDSDWFGDVWKTETTTGAPTTTAVPQSTVAP